MAVEDEHPDVVEQVDALARSALRRAHHVRAAPRIDDVADYDVAVVGVPFDSGVTYRPGARFGPGPHPPGVAAAAALQPRAGRRTVPGGAGGRRR